MPFTPKLLEYGVHIDRVPEYDDVDDKPQCPELILLAFAIALPQLAAFPVENRTRQAMAPFAAIQLQKRRAAFAFVVNVPQDMQRLGYFCPSPRKVPKRVNYDFSRRLSLFDEPPRGHF